MILRRLALLLGLLLALPGPAAAADPLEVVRQRGVLVVGVKADYPPFGMIGAAGELAGLEPDLAADLARQLGVAVQLVAVTSANRLQYLAEGRVDALIATLGVTPQRRALATMVEPDYYGSGVSLLQPAAAAVHDWSALRGKIVCAVQGAFYNERLAERFGFQLDLFNGTRDALLDLRQGACAGLLYDDSALEGQLATGKFPGYTISLPPLMESPWAIAIARDAKDSHFERAISDAVAVWHRSGLLLTLSERWHLPAAPELLEARQRWTATDFLGRPVCRRDASGAWPTACLDPPLLPDVAAIVPPLDAGWSGLPEGADRLRLLAALGTTLLLAGAALFGSLAVGIAGAALMAARLPLISPLVRGLATAGRMTPPLLQLYLVAFGFGQVAAAHLGIRLDNFLVAAFCLSAYAGAANSFLLREAWQVACGRGLAGRPRLVATAQLAYVPVMNVSVNIVKATGMASVIAVPELVAAATTLIAERGNSTVMMNLLLAAYVAIVLAVTLLLEAAGRWVQRVAFPPAG